MPVWKATQSSLARPYSFRYHVVSISRMSSALRACARTVSWLCLRASRELSWELRWPRSPDTDATDCLRCLNTSSGTPRPTEPLRAANMAAKPPPSQKGTRETLCTVRMLPERTRFPSVAISVGLPHPLSRYLCHLVALHLSYNLLLSSRWNWIWLSAMADLWDRAWMIELTLCEVSQGIVEGEKKRHHYWTGNVWPSIQTHHQSFHMKSSRRDQNGWRAQGLSSLEIL